MILNYYTFSTVSNNLNVISNLCFYNNVSLLSEAITNSICSKLEIQPV